MVKKVVVGTYSSKKDAEKAIEGLKEAGLENKDISVLFPESVGQKEFGMKKSTTKGATKEAGLGGAVGGLVGGLAGTVKDEGVLGEVFKGARSINIPDIGIILAVGPLVSQLSSTVTGTVSGIPNALAGMGIPEEEAQQHEERVKKGGILVAVQASADQPVEDIRKVMESTSEAVSSSEEGAGRMQRGKKAPAAAAEESAEQ